MTDGIIGAMNLSALGEFGLIELIRENVQSTYQNCTATGGRVLLGIGDDTAAWRPGPLAELATTDTLVQDVHFSFQWCTWSDLGHKSLAVNLSDIAAMGGTPRYALVSLSCPGEVEVGDVVAYYRAMTTLAVAHDVAIVGGNLTRAPLVMSTVMLMGEVDGACMLRRDAAMPGDLIAVTGLLGGAAAALRLLQHSPEGVASIPAPLLDALLRPHPRMAEGRALAAHGIRCGIDLSDGLLSDLGHVVEASGVSATIEASRLPACDWPGASGEERLQGALGGGEDYELLFTGAPGLVAGAIDTCPCPVAIVGRIGARTGAPAITVLDDAGQSIDVSHTGWRHFGR